VISEELAELAQIEYTRTDLLIQSVFSELSRPIGECDLVFEFQGIEMRCKAHIVSNSACPLILGQNFGIDTHLRIWMNNRRIDYFDFKEQKHVEINPNIKSFDMRTALRPKSKITEEIIIKKIIEKREKAQCAQTSIGYRNQSVIEQYFCINNFETQKALENQNTGQCKAQTHVNSIENSEETYYDCEEETYYDCEEETYYDCEEETYYDCKEETEHISKETVVKSIFEDIYCTETFKGEESSEIIDIFNTEIIQVLKIEKVLKDSELADIEKYQKEDHTCQEIINKINRAVLDMKPPKNVKEVRIFMGIINFLKSFFDPDIAQHSRNLFNLVKKYTVFDRGRPAGLQYTDL
jgi:hypothetical protein